VVAVVGAVVVVEAEVVVADRLMVVVVATGTLVVVVVGGAVVGVVAGGAVVGVVAGGAVVGVVAGGSVVVVMVVGGPTVSGRRAPHADVNAAAPAMAPSWSRRRRLRALPTGAPGGTAALADGSGPAGPPPAEPADAEPEPVAPRLETMAPR
jgi:hypothetical protein